MKNGQNIELASNAVSSLWLESTGNEKRILVKRPTEKAKKQFAFAKSWKAEQDTWSNLSHPNLLKITEMQADGSAVMDRTSLVSLEEYMADNPAFVTQVGELERIINELMDALHYLHQQGLNVIDLSPRNILLTRSNRTVKLFAACSPYLKCRSQLWPEPSDFLAPELREENVTITARADIYALGKVIEFIYANGSMPFRYKSVAKRCHDIDPMHRYVDIPSIQTVVGRREKLKKTRNSLYIMIAVGLATVFGIWMTTSYDNENFVHVKPAANSNNTISVIEARQQYGVSDDSLAAYLIDTLYTDEDWAISDSIKEKLSTIFRRQFRKKATPIIDRIYNQQLVNGTSNNFQIAITQGYDELKRVKEE
ncbi:MAG: protein kinase family protein, partial [Bacteroidaceae bacterium]|nr:protein kinase family protein [Bacteroidaceae bacterium]